MQAGESGSPGGVHALADRPPGDGHSHIVVGHGELLHRILKAHIDIVLILAQILCVIVGNHPFGLYRTGINSLIGNALDLIGFAANSDSQAAIDGITEAIGGELQVLIADAPFRTVHGKRPIRRTGLEVRRIVDTGDKAHLGPCGGRCHFRAIRDGCRENAERLGLDGVVMASAAAAILGGRMLPQVLGHIVQRSGNFVGVTHHVHRQLERLVLREGLVGIGESLDTVVLGLLHAGQLAALVVAHALIAGDQLVHSGLDTGGKQAGIVGQLVQLRAEGGQVLFILRSGVVLQLSDGFNGRLLGIAGLAGGGGSLDSGGAGIIGTLEFAPDSGTEIVFRIGGIRLVQLGLQSVFHGGQVVGRIHMNPNGCAAVCRIVFTCTAGALAVTVAVDVALFVLPQVIGSDQIPALTVQRHTGTAVCIGDNRFFILSNLLRGGVVIGGGFRHVTDKQGHVCARLDSTAATQSRLCLLDGQGKRFARLHLQPVALDKLRCLYTVDILPQVCAAVVDGGLVLSLRVQIEIHHDRVTGVQPQIFGYGIAPPVMITAMTILADIALGDVDAVDKDLGIRPDNESIRLVFQRVHRRIEGVVVAERHLLRGTGARACAVPLTRLLRVKICEGDGDLAHRGQTTVELLIQILIHLFIGGNRRIVRLGVRQHGGFGVPGGGQGGGKFRPAFGGIIALLNGIRQCDHLRQKRVDPFDGLFISFHRIGSIQIFLRLRQCSSRSVYLALPFRCIGGGGISVFIEEPVKQRLGCRARRIKGRPRVRSVFCCVFVESAAMHYSQRLMENRGVHLRGGNQVGNGGLQPGNGIVDSLLCYFCACIDSFCTFQFRLVFCPKAFSTGVLSVEHISSGVILPAIGSGGSFDRLL